jgi:hypothetical protein
MCSKATCSTCGKATWSGCGQHVEQALKGVPRAQRCRGHESTTPSSNRATSQRKGILARLFGAE